MTWNAKLPAVRLKHIPLAAVFAAVLNANLPVTSKHLSQGLKSLSGKYSPTLSDENYGKLLTVDQIRQGGGHRKGKGNLFFKIKQPIREKTDPLNESFKYLVLSSMTKAKSQVRIM